MASVLSGQKTPRLTVTNRAPTRKSLAPFDQLLVLMPAKAGLSEWKQLPDGERLKKLAARRGKDSTPALAAHLNTERPTGVTVGLLKSDADVFGVSECARAVAASGLAERPSSIALIAPGFADEARDSIIALLAEAVLIGNFKLPKFGTAARHRNLSRVRAFDVGKKCNPGAITARAEANNLARWLAALPPNILDAAAYREAAGELAHKYGWASHFYGESELESLGAGAFLAVARGNAKRDAGILHLKYRPQSAKAAAIVALVGKGIIFDTGGNNLKPFKSMLDMHTDMQGSAVALATLQALSALQVPIAVDCWLAITENRIGPEAYKSQDLIRAMNGKTIQTIHTDAEGRMALADTLALASESDPDFMIDFATLTGACVNATTTRMSGVFSNRKNLHPLLKRAGVRSGERVWPFPIGDEFMVALKSDTADLKQCAVDGHGDHILAASFLNEFVPKRIPWVHVDLSASDHTGGLGLVPSDITGFGVRYTLDLLLDPEHSVLKRITDE